MNARLPFAALAAPATAPRSGLLNRDGFTLIELLIELLIVILVVGILLAIALPSFLEQQDKAHDSEAKQELATVFRVSKAIRASDEDQKFPGQDEMITELQASEPQLDIEGAVLPALDYSDKIKVARVDEDVVVATKRSKSGATLCLVARSDDPQVIASGDTEGGLPVGCPITGESATPPNPEGGSGPPPGWSPPPPPPGGCMPGMPCGPGGPGGPGPNGPAADAFQVTSWTVDGNASNTAGSGVAGGAHVFCLNATPCTVTFSGKNAPAGASLVPLAVPMSPIPATSSNPVGAVANGEGDFEGVELTMQFECPSMAQAVQLKASTDSGVTTNGITVNCTPN